MIGDNIPLHQYVFFGIYAALFLVLAYFLNKFIIRKKSNKCINFICVLLLFSTFFMILIFPMDLFSDFLVEDTPKQKKNKKIISEILFWNFYLFGFVIIEQYKGIW